MKKFLNSILLLVILLINFSAHSNIKVTNSARSDHKIQVLAILNDGRTQGWGYTGGSSVLDRGQERTLDLNLFDPQKVIGIKIIAQHWYIFWHRELIYESPVTDGTHFVCTALKSFHEIQAECSK